MEASEERIGSVIDSALLLCYHYDPSTGKYGAAALRLVRIGAVATIVAFGVFLFVSMRARRSGRVASVNRPKRCSRTFPSFRSRPRRRRGR